MKLTLGQFLKDTEKRNLIAKKLSEVESLSQELNLRISISIEGESIPPVMDQNGKATIPQGENTISGRQLAFEILRAAGKPMAKVDLLKAIHERGVKMPMESLTSYLSRGKKHFSNVSFGRWEAIVEPEKQ